jgi:hypothetical protein
MKSGLDPRSIPSTILVTLTSSASQILNSVVSLIGRPASICCQWRGGVISAIAQPPRASAFEYDGCVR